MRTIWLTRNGKDDIEIILSENIDDFQVFYYEDGQRYLRESKRDFKDFLVKRMDEGFRIIYYIKGGEFED